MKKLSQINLSALRAFEAVARLGSVRAAAVELGVTAGAVSQQILKAEAQLGRQLFERSPKGMMPDNCAHSSLFNAHTIHG